MKSNGILTTGQLIENSYPFEQVKLHNLAHKEYKQAEYEKVERLYQKD